MAGLNLLLLILITGLIFSLATFLLHKFIKIRWIKYIPALVQIFIIIFWIIKAKFYSEGMEGLGYIILVIIGFGSLIITSITLVVLEVRGRREKL